MPSILTSNEINSMTSRWRSSRWTKECFRAWLPSCKSCGSSLKIQNWLILALKISGCSAYHRHFNHLVKLQLSMLNNNHNSNKTRQNHKTSKIISKFLSPNTNIIELVLIPVVSADRHSTRFTSTCNTNSLRRFHNKCQQPLPWSNIILLSLPRRPLPQALRLLEASLLSKICCIQRLRNSCSNSLGHQLIIFKQGKYSRHSNSR